MGHYDLGDLHALLGALEACVNALGAGQRGVAAASAAWERA